MTKRAIIYIRVSTQSQADDGVSLSHQKEKAQAWCTLNDYEYNEDWVFEDAGISGTTTEKREAFKNAMNEAKKGDAFVVYSISRFGRNAREVLNNAADLEKRGIDFVSITEKTDTTTPQGKFFFLLMAGLAQFTSDTIKADTKKNMAKKKADGMLVGSVPYGFDAIPTGKKSEKSGREEKKLIPNESEQLIIEKVITFRKQRLSLQKISHKLHTLGFKPRNGEIFQTMTIKRIIDNNQKSHSHCEIG
jgi:site-specific DNA recombinase